MTRWTTLVVTLFLLAPRAGTAQVEHLELKWMRDSEEYQRLVEQVFHAAGQAVETQRRTLARGTVWGVVLDVDETTLDNSVYQLERAAYALPYDTASWNAFVRRETATPLPGVKAFLDAVRGAGGRVAFVTNRHEWVRDATRRNLAHVGLWQDGDRLCLKTVDDGYTKRVRRTEVRTGRGPCAWEGQPVRVLVYVGDAMGDFPEADEGVPGGFGVNFFVIPNPSYGEWERGVTRKLP